jgi:hypothetical protein
MAQTVTVTSVSDGLSQVSQIGVSLSKASDHYAQFIASVPQEGIDAKSSYIIFLNNQVATLQALSTAISQAIG